MELDIYKPTRNYDRIIQGSRTIDNDSNYVKFKNKTNKMSQPRTFTKKPKKSGVKIGNHNLIDTSENLTDNTNSMRKILTDTKSVATSEPLYISQFDMQTFDSQMPSAVNDIYETNDKSKLADLERQISYNGGWSQYSTKSMSYGQIPDSQLTHNNTTPSFSTKHGYGTNDSRTHNLANFKNDLFTGTGIWTDKKENKPLFKPVANLTHMYGTPVASDDEKDRYQAGRYMQGALPFEQVRVTPGVGIGRNEVGRHGLHPTYREMAKTIDDLRVNPKTTIEGRVIEGMRGQARPLQAPVVQYKPDTFYTNNEDDMLPSITQVKGPKTIDNYIMKIPNKAEQLVEYTGCAYVSADTVGQNVPEYMRPKIKESTRQNFILPDPMQKHSKAESIYNPNHNQYVPSVTTKEQLIQNNYTGVLGTPIGSKTYVNNGETAKHTLKELLAEQQTISYITPNTMRGTAHNMTPTNTTFKELLNTNTIAPHVVKLVDAPMTYNNDSIKTTMKELNTGSVPMSNIGQNINLYVSTSEPTRTTGREIIDIGQQQMVVAPSNVQQAPHSHNISRTTNKETLVTIPYQTTILPVNQQQRAPDYQDTMRTTAKETIINNICQSYVTPINRQRAPEYQHAIKTTAKETINIPYQSHSSIVPINQQQAIGPQGPTRTTNKETVNVLYEPNIVPINQQQAPNMEIPTTTTTKETLINAPAQMAIAPINLQQAPHPQDIMRTTNKELLTNNYHQSHIAPVNLQRTVEPQYPLQTTLKETIVNVPNQTVITPVNQQQRAPGPQGPTKTTNKETVVTIPYNTNMTGIGQQQGSGAVYNRDPARTTIKDIVVSVPHNTNITGIGQQQGSAAVYNRDPVRTTAKDSVISIPYNTNITGIGQTQGSAAVYNRLPVRTTTKESISEMPATTYATVVGQQQGTAAAYNRDPVKTTIKESIVEIPTNTNITSITQQGSAASYDRAPVKTTAKEGLIEIPYNSTITAIGQQQGSAATYDRAPVRSTISETTIENNYIGPLHGVNKPCSYESAYNVVIDDKKQSALCYRKPSARGVNLPPDPSMINIQLKSDNNLSQNPAAGYTYNSMIDRLVPSFTSRINNNCDQSYRFIDPAMLAQLESS